MRPASFSVATEEPERIRIHESRGGVDKFKLVKDELMDQ